MTLANKIATATAAIDRCMQAYRKPAFMCSFGKDSMVLLHLLAQKNIRVPIIFHRDPWWPEKYQWIDTFIANHRLEVHDYAPLAVSLWEGEGIMAFSNHYQIGPLPGGVALLPKNIIKPVEGQRFLCGLKDVLSRPTGSFNFPWDSVFVGHKSSDEDQIAGKIPLHCDIKLNNGVGPDLVFPLRQWTDNDVWDYTEAHGIPQQPDRYDVVNRCELPDKTRNSDYAHVCIACCDRRSKAVSVHCPKLNCEVSTVADKVPYFEPILNYYGEAANA